MNLRLQTQFVSLVSNGVFDLGAASLVLERFEISTLLVVLGIDGILSDGLDVNLHILTLVTVVHRRGNTLSTTVFLNDQVIVLRGMR